VGHLKKMKLSTHFTAGSILWNFSSTIVVSATAPWMPPAVASPSIATLHIHQVFPGDAKVLLVSWHDGGVSIGFGYVQ